MPRKDAAADMSVQLVQRLEAERLRGADAYPSSLARLAEAMDPVPSAAVVLKATGKAPFKERVIMPRKQLDAPIAFAGDLAQLASSARLLQYALSLVCTPAKPTAALTALVNKLDKRFREPFAAAVRQWIQDQRLPDGIEVLRVGRAERLHPLHLPLPKKPEVELAEQLLRLLHTRDRQSEFWSLEALLESAGLHPKTTVLNKALAEKQFREQAIVPLPKVKTGPVGLRKDRERLLGSPALLHLLLQTQRKPTEQVVAVKKLASKLSKEERQPFMEVVNGLLDTDKQPAGLGWIWSGKQRCLLLLSDLHGAQPVVTPAPVVPPDFAAAFEQAFRTLDRQSGQHNFVKLTALRHAVPVARTAFDAGLRDLRRAGRYSLSAAEGRHGLNTEDREAGILEDGSLLLYVSKKEP